MDFSGIWIPLVTPLREGVVDMPALRRLVQHLAVQGVAGFVACGSTGEAALLDDDEQDRVLSTTVEASSGLPVLFGLSGSRTQQLAERAHHLAQTRLPGGFLVSAPAYVRPSQAGIVDHFTTIADATPLPVVAYDVPARTGVRIEVRTLLELAAHERIVAVKDCSGDRAAAEALLADGRLALLAGNDDELFDQLARGATGAISASAHLATARFVALAKALRDGELATARTLWNGLAPLTRAVFAEPNPAPLKAALARQGWLAGELRSPMRQASEATAVAVLQAERLSRR
jgi:4-hydroxy-tetrahydrodipicolinate synthase